MDVVGPVTESSSGNKYILVLSDYASRYCHGRNSNGQFALAECDALM
jgi:hypothetical protein